MKPGEARDSTGFKLTADILDSITESFLAIDREWRVTYANRRVLEKIGKTAEELIGRSLWDVAPEAKATDFYPQYLRVLEERTPAQFELYYPPSDRWYEVYAHPTAEGLSAYIVDITARKVAEERVLRSERRFRALVENSEAGIAVTDRTGRVLYMARSLLGYREGEWDGRNAFEVAHPEDRAQAFMKFVELLQMPGGMVTFEARARHADGSWRWMVLLLKNLLDDPDVSGVVVNYRDITLRKQFEERLLQTQKLESLGVLAGGVAHDFNNLLVGIMGNASLAFESLPDYHPVRPMLRDVIAASERAAALTRQMLAYSGKGKFVIKRIDLSRMAEELREILRTSVPRNVELRFELAAELPTIEADPWQIQQLLMNLVINSSEAIGEAAGMVAIRTGMVETTETIASGVDPAHDLTPGTYVVLEIEDNGEGMDHGTAQKIFDPFFTTRMMGRGLGLAAVQGILRGHKGGVRVESAPGRGSRFTVYFPAG